MATPHVLPTINKFAIWHSEAGLITSIFGILLPEDITEDPDSRKPSDYLRPRPLSDSNIYLACYPRISIFRSTLFSVLLSTPNAIPGLIEPIISHGRPTQFILEASVRTAWTQLEDGLLATVDILINNHPAAREMPTLTHLRHPEEYGYRVPHSSVELAVSCAKRARGAFHSLSALVTFALLLWLTREEKDCFDQAFSKLAQNEIPQVWIDHLHNSVVCNLSLSARPGGFLNGYSTRWGPIMKNFCHARIPIWIMWGISPSVPEDRKFYSWCYPPPEIIKLVKKRPAQYAKIVLPNQGTYRFYPDSSVSQQPAVTSSQPQPQVTSSQPPVASSQTSIASSRPSVASSQRAVASSSRPPVGSSTDWFNSTSLGSSQSDSRLQTQAEQHLGVPNANTGQRQGESWADFSARMERVLESRKSMEDSGQRQQRESREAYALKHGFSSTSVVFVWEKDDQHPTFYRRTRLIKPEVQVTWDGFTDRQRIFWSHTNEWDLCPQISPFASNEDAHAEQARIEALDDSEDEDYSILYSKPSKQARRVQNERLADELLESVRAAVTQNVEVQVEEGVDSWYEVKCMDTLEYLRKRHGFHADAGQSWSSHLHNTQQPLQRTQHEIAAKHLLHGPMPADIATSTLVSIVDFHNTARSNLMISYTALPQAWDISRFVTVNPSLVCDLSRIALQRVSCVSGKEPCLYILRPPQGSKDTSPWFIATTSATTVLLVYRSPWTTMVEICRGLLHLGISFRTVVQTNCHPPPQFFNRPGRLGLRSNDFLPREEDYFSYKLARDQVLRSSSGRAVRLRGGLAGRIASNIVSDFAVLDGPSLGNEVVGRHGDQYFVDDELTDHDADIVMGVYCVQTQLRGAPVVHRSWWPKLFAWSLLVHSGDQWNPSAENFYQERLKEFNDGKFNILSATDWREKYKYYRSTTRLILNGSEKLAAEFLAKSTRVR